LEGGTESQWLCHTVFVFCLIDSIMSLTGMSVIVGRAIVLVALSADMSAISLSAIPICDGTHINSIFLVVRDNSFWMFWVISLDGNGFWRARRALSESLIMSMQLFEIVSFISLIASNMA